MSPINRNVPMPARTRRLSHHPRRHVFRSMVKKNKGKKFTLKRNQFRIASHSYHPKRGKRVSQRNIHRSIEHMLPYNMNLNRPVDEPNMPNASQPRARLSRAAKTAYRNRLAAEQAVREANRAARAEAQSARAATAAQHQAHAESMNDIMERMSKLGL